MLVYLDRRRSVRCLCFPLEKATFELNFSSMEMACCITMHVHFTHCVVRARLDASPRREDNSRSIKLFHEIFPVVNMIVIKSARFMSGMFRVRYAVLMHAPS